MGEGIHIQNILFPEKFIMQKTNHIYFIIFSIFLACSNITVLAATQNTADSFADPQNTLENLTPNQMKALEQTAEERLNNLTPAQKESLVQTAKEYLNDISPAEKKVLMESTQKNLNMVTPEEKQTISKAAQKDINNLMPDQK